jgi:membrane-associated phospholipid phosphatase
VSQDILARLTHIGDPTMLFLGGLGVFLYLWSDDERRILAHRWVMAFGLCVLLTVVSKFVFHLIRWNEGTAFRLLSPSGHVAIATGFYGCCATMLTARSSRAVRILVCISTILLLSLIAASRLVLGLHSIPEIIVAFGIGGASLAVFAFHEGHRVQVRLNAGQMISLILLVFFTYYMPRLNGEALIINFVQRIDR